MKGAVLIALVVVPQWRCPILKPLSAKLPPKSETAPHPGWQDGTILQPGRESNTIGDGRRGTAKGELCSRREPRTFGKWMAASKTEKKAPKKKRSGRFNGPSYEDMALSK